LRSPPPLDKKTLEESAMTFYSLPIRLGRLWPGKDIQVNLLSSIWRRQTEAALLVTHILEPNGHPPLEVGEGGDGYRFIARQAIFDRTQLVHGYELLCRSGWQNHFVGDSDEATRMMIADCALYGFQDLTRGGLAFVNCTRESIVDGLVTLLPTSTVLEILETVTPDAEVLQALLRYKKLGYRIALDDFRMNEATNKLVSLADYIKVDFRLSDAAERQGILKFLHGRKVCLLAEKIETEEEFQMAMEEGFELFQGYFFCHPTVFSKKRSPTNGANYLLLLSAISQDNFDVVQITSLLKSEVSLCYQLLRLVNSAAFGISHEVHSLHDALVLVGEEQFRKLMINAIATETCRTRPQELLIHVLHRARFLELLAPFTDENPAEQYLFGLLSLMDVMLDLPVEDMISALPLREELKLALCGANNRIAMALRLLQSYEDGDWILCEERSRHLHISEGEVSHLYQESLRWAERATNASQQKPMAFL
jgi:c-di-GMP-related signal transduction protein